MKALRAAIAAGRQAVSANPLEVTTLDLSEKSLRTLPDFLGECENLERLILRKNELEGVPGVLRCMKKLQVLDLYGNWRIGALPGWLAALPLKELNLGLGYQETLPAVIPEIKTLEVLELYELYDHPPHAS